MKINIKRLMNDINSYGNYGIDKNGGVTRPSFSKDDYVVRDRFVKELKQMGLQVEIDPIANIWGRYTGQSQKDIPIVIGSHLDTVPNGGKYDGALGVLVAKEVIQTIIENKISLQHPIELVSFTAEEPNDFNLSTMGSRTLVGKLDQITLMKTKDSKGTLLKDAVHKAGGNLEKLPIPKKKIAAFLELHIEQGKRLETANCSVAVVDNIVGIYRDRVIIQGEANHAGTTMMLDRRDALTTASEMAIAVENILIEHGTEAVATVGKFDVFPNAANIIPGKVEMILEIRSRSKEERLELKRKIYQKWNDILKKRQVTIETENILDQQECNFDSDIVAWLQETINNMNIPYRTFSSMAGHDATHIAELGKTAMLFVKSVDGKSHCPEEFSKEEDIEIAANAMLQAVLNIDKNL